MLNVSFTDINPDIKGIYRINLHKFHEPTILKAYFTCRILLILKGNGKFYFKDRTFDTSPNSVLFIPAMEQYTTTFYDEQDIVQICFDFIPYRNDFVAAEDLKVITGRENGNFDATQDGVCIDDTPLFLAPFLTDTIPDVVSRAESILQEYREKRYGYQLRQKAMLLDLLVFLRRFHGLADDVRESANISKLLNYINENCENKQLKNDLCQLFHYHPNHINRLVRNATGLPLHQYIIEAKLRRAEELLRDTDTSITQIAQELSFYDGSHFSSVFLRYKKISPREYRWLHRKLY